MINNKKNGSTKEEVKQHLQNKGERNVVGGAGGLGFVGGAGVKVAKGAFQVIKNLLTRGSKPKSIGGFREICKCKIKKRFKSR